MAAPTLHRLEPELYDRLVDTGVLEGQPVELVEGLLVHMSPQGPEHAALVHALTIAFAARADLLRIQMPLAVPDGRPEPDVALAETRSARHHPSTAALVVEVAVSSHAESLAKLPSYARADVGVVWLVDVPGRVVAVHEEPRDGVYTRTWVARDGDRLQPPVEGLAPLVIADLFAILDR